jgi:serine/threonine protein kinase
LLKNFQTKLYVIIKLIKNDFKKKVWKINHKKTKKLYALKEMSKAKIIDKKSEKSIKYEKELLCRLKHP